MSSLFDKIAASVVAPAPSTINLDCSIKNNMAFEISPSFTVTI